MLQVHGKKSWQVRRGYQRCTISHSEWRPETLPLHLTRQEWVRLRRPQRYRHCSGGPAGVEAGVAGPAPGAPVHDAGGATLFSGIVEVEEAYPGGVWRNRRQAERAEGRANRPSSGSWRGAGRSGLRWRPMRRARRCCPCSSSRSSPVPTSARTPLPAIEVASVQP